MWPCLCSRGKFQRKNSEAFWENNLNFPKTCDFPLDSAVLVLRTFGYTKSSFHVIYTYWTRNVVLRVANKLWLYKLYLCSGKRLSSFLWCIWRKNFIANVFAFSETDSWCRSGICGTLWRDGSVPDNTLRRIAAQHTYIMSQNYESRIEKTTKKKTIEKLFKSIWSPKKPCCKTLTFLFFSRALFCHISVPLIFTTIQYTYKHLSH